MNAWLAFRSTAGKYQVCKSHFFLLCQSLIMPEDLTHYSKINYDIKSSFRLMVVVHCRSQQAEGNMSVIQDQRKLQSAQASDESELNSS